MAASQILPGPRFFLLIIFLFNNINSYKTINAIILFSTSIITILFCFLLAKSWKGIKGIAGVAAGAAVRIIVIRSCFNIFLSFYRLLEFVRAGISLELLKGRSRWIRRCSHVLIMLPLDNLRSSAIFKEPPCYAVKKEQGVWNGSLDKFCTELGVH